MISIAFTVGVVAGIAVGLAASLFLPYFKGAQRNEP
jgi:hypothetical protein